MSILYLVPTPIGNIRDITFRAVEVLQEVDLILAEDTRKTGVLLRHYNIRNRVASHHQFNEHRFAAKLADRILEGEKIALVSDAGTPGISDPGFLLVRECLQRGIAVECLPGPVAFVPALVQSGLPCDRFFFEGFLPVKKGRASRLEYLCGLEQTVILYESPHRLLKTLRQLVEYFGPSRNAAVSRELTKIFEETARGTLEELLHHFESGTLKGEFVIVIGGK
jgi:16S rRNA (cytidine1402-2'-O)-methyltransferase